MESATAGTSPPLHGRLRLRRWARFLPATLIDRIFLLVAVLVAQQALVMAVAVAVEQVDYFITGLKPQKHLTVRPLH